MSRKMNKPTLQSTTLMQLTRYGITGILNNFLGYLIYILITFLWLDPKVAISLFYPIGAVTAYIGHSKYSFAYQGNRTAALIRYSLAYFSGYGVNLMMLFILSDKLKCPHQIVQAIAIPLVAIVLFLMLKYFVFPPPQIKGTT